MKPVLFLFLLLVMFISPELKANTYLWFWINGEKSTQLAQGDVFAWEYDVSSPGNTALVEIWLDLDGSRNITEGDILLEEFMQRDGEMGNDGPADSSSTPDGIVYVMLGQFGFGPQNYLLKVTDEDESTSMNYFEITGMSSPPATASGRIYIEGSPAPDAKLKNVMIGAMGENGIFSGLTDVNGNYIINLPLADAAWEISPMFDRSLPGYIRQENRYQQIFPGGNTDSLNFHFSLPSSYVYGNVYDQDSTLVELNTRAYLSNWSTNSETWGLVENGHYNLAAQVEIMGNDSVNSFSLRLETESLMPDYLAPNGNHPFNLTYGDSIQYDLIIYATNSSITGYVTENSQTPSQQYLIMAWSDSLGSSMVYSDQSTGYFELAVRTGSIYYVNIQESPEWGTPPPPGLVLENNSYSANPGDVVRFNYVPAESAIQGTISFDAGDPSNLFRYDESSVGAQSESTQKNFQGNINQDNTFFIPVLNGTYNVQVHMNQETNPYLAMPNLITGVSVSNDTVKSLNFMLNYAHADLTVKLIGAPVKDLPGGYGINTTGEWPNIYQLWQNKMMPDSTFHFRVCEGTWHLQVPIWVDGQMYDLVPSDTFLTVTEQDSSYYVEFVYQLKTTGIAAESAIPAEFHLDQNYPNPFNPSTTIAYGLPKAGNVRVTIYNMLGEKVEILCDTWQNAGNYTIKWMPKNISSGVYLYQIETADRVQTKKMIFMK